MTINMAVSLIHASIFFAICMINVNIIVGTEWPIPYKRIQSRPISSPYCQWGVLPFCPTGEAADSMPYFEPNHVIEIYALKKPVWQFKFGDLMKKFNIMHDAIGIKNVNTSRNFTMEWYELYQLFNCTFPHVLPNKAIQWCNQGASCIYRGINDHLWQQNGTLSKVATITGDQFNQFSEWVLWDNRTGIYYETWTVSQQPGGQMWFDSFDCASWVLRAFAKMGEIGVKFNHSVKLNYTRINLYSDAPIHLGNATQIFGPAGNKTLAKSITDFYSLFQPHEETVSMIYHVLEALEDVVHSHLFYFYYNSEYWQLPMKSPYVKLSYKEVPLP